MSAVGTAAVLEVVGDHESSQCASLSNVHDLQYNVVQYNAIVHD